MTSRHASADHPVRDPQFRLTLIFLAVITLLRLAWLAGRPIDLYPDEAQYWVWAQHPAWGYFSKPPMVAWLIAASIQCFGDSDLAVKLPATLTYFFTSLVVYKFAERLYDSQTAGWSAIAFITLPSVSLSSVVISTDVPLLFFWASATYALVRAREPGSASAWWFAVGVSAGLGLLSKYAMGFWLGSAFGFLLLMPGERRHLRGYAVAVLIAVITYAPNFFWNAANGFASYRHTAANADIHGIPFHPGAFLEFAGSQFAVFGPVFAASLLAIASVALRNRFMVDSRAWFLLVLSLPTLMVMLCESILSRAQPNWSAPAYVTATVLVVAWLRARGREGLVQWSVVGHVVLAVALFGANDVARALHLPLAAKYDAVHRLRGWHVLGQAVSESLIEAPRLPLLADSRELMAALIYYMRPHPFDMLMWNPAKGINNGFEMTQSLPGRAGGDYLWLSDRPDDVGATRYFARSEEIAHIRVPIGRGLARDVHVIALYGFKGY